MSLYDEIYNREEKISLIGLGYVGMPLVVAFAKKVDVIGFDLNKNKIEQYKQGIDPTNEVGDEAIQQTTVDFTSDETRLREAKFHIVAVPTPINSDKTPDLTPVEGASTIIGRNLTKGSIVVFESTVYPGVTEDVCIPILEKESGLKCGLDFKVGYSPERINSGKGVIIRHKNLIELGNGVSFGDYVEIDGLSVNGIKIGNNVKIGSFSKIRCTGTLTKIGKGIVIGNNCGFDDFCFFGASGGIEIGDNVIAGQSIKFHSENHIYSSNKVLIKDQGVSNKGIKIDGDCWIGSNTVFLDGVNVGKGCVIGANTIVNRDIPPFSVAVGNPVRVIRSRK